MDTFYLLLGIYACYSWGHIGFLQNTIYKKRTSYEKFVTWFGGVALILMLIGMQN